MSKPLNSERVPLRTVAIPEKFEPKLSQVQTESVAKARQIHRPISNNYIWCDWNGSVGFLKVEPEYNYCSNCTGVLWSSYDKSPADQKRRWIRPGNVIQAK